MKCIWTLFVTLFLVGSAHAQDKPIYNIGILTDTLLVEQAPILQRLQNEITAVVGEDATIQFSQDLYYVNNFDLVTAENQYNALVAGEADIILAFGAVINEVVSRQEAYPKPTILFGTLNLDLVDIDETRTTSGIDNFTFLVASQSYRQDLEAFKSLYDFQHVGVLVEQNRFEALEIEPVMDEIFEGLGADYTLILYDETEDLDGYLAQIDAVYIAEGFNLTEAKVKALADRLFDLGIPSFTSSPLQDVAQGIMATTQSEENLDQFFRRIALYVEAVVNGENLADLPLYIESNSRLTMNVHTAQKVGVSPRYSQIATTDFVGSFENSLAEKRYSLLDVMEEALEQNFLITLSRRNVDVADLDVKSAKTAYLPSVTASASGVYIDQETAEFSNGQNPEYSTDGSITLQQTIFSDAANANISIQESLANAERADLTTAELDLVLNAANAYFNILILKSNLRIRNENLSVTKRNLEIAEQNFEAGQSGRSDVLRFQSEMAQNMQSLVEAANQLEQAFLALNQLLSAPLERELDVEQAEISQGLFENYRYDQMMDLLDDPATRETFEEFLVTIALENAPELQALSYEMEVVDRNILLNGPRRFLPTIAAQAQYNRTIDQWGVGVPPPEFTLKDNYNVGVSLSIPIIDQNRKNVNRQTAQIQREQLLLNQENTRLSVGRNVRDAVLDMINQIASIELSQVSEDAARSSLELIQTAYESGAVNIVQLIDAQTNLVQAQLASANATYNYLLSSIILERYIGYYFLLHTEEENQAFINRFLAFQSEASD